MIKRTLKNYLSNLKFVFTPIGILTIFALIGVSIAINGCYNAVVKMFSDVGKAVSSVHFDISAGINAGVTRFTSVDWKDIDNSLGQIMSKDWVLETLKLMGKAAFSNSEEIIAELELAASTCLTSIVINIVIFLVFILLGLIVGYVVLKIFVTRQMVSKRKFGKALLKSLLHALINLFIILIIVSLFGLLKLPLVANLIITFIIFFTLNLFESYLIFGVKKVPFKKFINWKNILFVLLSGLIVIAITAGLCVGTFYLFRIVTAVVLINGLAQVGIVTIELLGESYINSLQENETPNNSGTMQEATPIEEK